jgi:hypothetical protein
MPRSTTTFKQAKLDILASLGVKGLTVYTDTPLRSTSEVILTSDFGVATDGVQTLTDLTTFKNTMVAGFSIPETGGETGETGGSTNEAQLQQMTNILGNLVTPNYRFEYPFSGYNDQFTETIISYPIIQEQWFIDQFNAYNKTIYGDLYLKYNYTIGSDITQFTKIIMIPNDLNNFNLIFELSNINIMNIGTIYITEYELGNSDFTTSVRLQSAFSVEFPGMVNKSYGTNLVYMGSSLYTNPLGFNLSTGSNLENISFYELENNTFNVEIQELNGTIGSSITEYTLDNIPCEIVLIKNNDGSEVIIGTCNTISSNIINYEVGFDKMFGVDVTFSEVIPTLESYIIQPTDRIVIRKGFVEGGPIEATLIAPINNTIRYFE